jgi:hypothetical protein
MASDKTKEKVLGPDLFDTRLRNQFLKTSKIANKDIEKQMKDLPDDTEWATWVPLDQIIKEDDDEDEDQVDEIPSTH